MADGTGWRIAAGERPRSATDDAASIRALTGATSRCCPQQGVGHHLLGKCIGPLHVLSVHQSDAHVHRFMQRVVQVICIGLVPPNRVKRPRVALVRGDAHFSAHLQVPALRDAREADVAEHARDMALPTTGRWRRTALAQSRENEEGLNGSIDRGPAARRGLVPEADSRLPVA